MIVAKKENRASQESWLQRHDLVLKAVQKYYKSGHVDSCYMVLRIGKGVIFSEGDICSK